MKGHLVFLHRCSLTLAQTVMVKYGSPYILTGRRHEVMRYQGGLWVTVQLEYREHDPFSILPKLHY